MEDDVPRATSGGQRSRVVEPAARRRRRRKLLHAFLTFSYFFLHPRLVAWLRRLNEGPCRRMNERCRHARWLHLRCLRCLVPSPPPSSKIRERERGWRTCSTHTGAHPVGLLRPHRRSTTEGRKETPWHVQHVSLTCRCCCFSGAEAVSASPTSPSPPLNVPVWILGTAAALLRQPAFSFAARLVAAAGTGSGAEGHSRL